jgi:hypothetical protein
MDHTKLFGMFANDVSNENAEKNPTVDGAKEIRLLNDLELAFAAGGDGIVIWDPPTGP